MTNTPRTGKRGADVPKSGPWGPMTEGVESRPTYLTGTDTKDRLTLTLTRDATLQQHRFPTKGGTWDSTPLSEVGGSWDLTLLIHLLIE